MERVRVLGCSITGEWDQVPHLASFAYLPALPLRGRQALRHGADLSRPSGSDPPGRTLDQAVRSVGRSAGGGGWVVF